MRLRTIAGVIAGLTVAAAPAVACNGNTLFTDDFSDIQISKDAWDPPSEIVTISRGYMELKPAAGKAVTMTIPVRIRSNEFEVCADILSPEGPQRGRAWAGFIFWFKSWQGFSYVNMSPSGMLISHRSLDGRDLPLGADKIYDVINKGPGARNSLRLAVKGNVGVAYANERRVTSFRGYPTDATGWIMLMGQSELEQENIWRFTNVKLTEPSK